MPFFSIVTVVKDDAAGLIRTRESLRGQGWRDVEWLCADGGSTDGTAELLAGWAGELAWWRSGPDGGPFAAMNEAAARARGRYLLFLNGGDRLASGDVLAAVAAQAVRHGFPGLLYGDTLEDPGDGRPRLRPARDVRHAWYGMPAHHCALFYRRDIVAGLAYPAGYRIAADYAYTLAALARVPDPLRLRMTVAEFAPGGLSRRHPALGRREQDHIRRDLLGMGPVSRGAIMAMQHLSSGLRRLAPATYACIRFRSTRQG